MSEQIADLNDRFRGGDMSLGRYYVTPKVQALPPDKGLQLFHLVRNFNSFDEGNDPYGERHFGKVTLDEQNYFWKIDYYDLTMTRHSEDAASPALTRRVMTLMCCDEY